jgi:nucleoside-diphosphate-sugar epimerase
MSHTGVADIGNCEVLSGDMRCKMELEEIIQGYDFDGIFHLAARTHPPTSFQEPVSYFETNAMGAVYLAEAIRKYSPETWLMNCSTCEVYGIHPEGSRISENTPTLASNPYSVSKLAADLYIKERSDNGLLRSFTTRAFSHTGPGRPKNYSISSDAFQIARIIKGKQKPEIRVGNLDSRRVVMDVRDVAIVYSQLMDSYMGLPSWEQKNGEVWNIGGDDLHDMRYYLQTMLDIFDVDAETKVCDKLYRKFDIPVQWPDSTKTRSQLGWDPQYDIVETLTDLVNFWLERV